MISNKISNDQIHLLGASKLKKGPVYLCKAFIGKNTPLSNLKSETFENTFNLKTKKWLK